MKPSFIYPVTFEKSFTNTTWRGTNAEGRTIIAFPELTENHYDTARAMLASAIPRP